MSDPPYIPDRASADRAHQFFKEWDDSPDSSDSPHIPTLDDWTVALAALEAKHIRRVDHASRWDSGWRFPSGSPSLDGLRKGHQLLPGHILVAHNRKRGEVAIIYATQNDGGVCETILDSRNARILGEQLIYHG